MKIFIFFFHRFREMFLRPKLSILYSMYQIGIICLYIYIFTHAFLHISVQLEGESILTAEMLGSILIAEMLVKTISKGNHFICGNAGRKQFQGGSIPTAENACVKNNLKGETFKLLKGWFKKKTHFQGGNILTDEMLVKNHFEGGNILTAEKLVKNNFKGGSILSAEMLVKKQFQSKHSNC